MDVNSYIRGEGSRTIGGGEGTMDDELMRMKNMENGRGGEGMK